MSMQSVVLPDDLRYDEHHQWARWEDPVWRCGLSAYQADAAGSLVFVGLPVPGSPVRAGEELGSVESGKWVSSLFAPVDGVVEAVNNVLHDDPETVNRDPYGEGWIFTVRPASELRGLTAEEYAEVIRREEAQDAPRIRERAE
jgi:glycine cleavage system H protein